MAWRWGGINHVGSAIIGELSKEPPAIEVSESFHIIAWRIDDKGTFLLRSKYEFVLFVDQLEFKIGNIVLGAAYFQCKNLSTCVDFIVDDIFSENTVK